MLNKNICIVTPDIVGPIKNGGIGTHCFFLANELVDSGAKVTVLFTGPTEDKNSKFWIKYYQARDITFIDLKTLKIESNIVLHNDFLADSYKIFQYLKNQTYDFIHFQDWQANGFVSIQAKQTTSDFDKTILTVTLHSSTKWQNEGMNQWNHTPVLNARLAWCEKFCAEHCDIVISPSKHMFDWALNSNWKLVDFRKTLAYCYHNTTKEQAKDISVNTKHLIFFGRLETRKGLEYFCDTILTMFKEEPSVVQKITFLGKLSIAGGIRSDKYIHNKLRNKIEYQIISNLNTFDAIEYIKKTQGLVVISSLLDNYPYTVIECIENKIPFLASNVGGIPEMVNPNIIFDIKNKYSLTNLLQNLNTINFNRLTHKYSAKLANQDWVSFHYEKVNSNIKIFHEKPLVSICIPYYNHPIYLPELIESIKKSSYQDFEVIIVNDGSTLPLANKVFEKLKYHENDARFSFFEKENEGVGLTRNFAANKAKGQYLIFMDADNLATPKMIEKFLFAIQKSGCDCVTSYFNAFKENKDSIDDIKPLYSYLPIGPALEIGMIENVFGDANFIIKRDVFHKLGGFQKDKTTSWEDYEFLARLSLNKYKQIVVPEVLFLYRHTEEGVSRTTDLNKNHKRILKTYSDNSPIYLGEMMESILLPYYYQSPKYNKLCQWVEQLIDFILPINSYRREIIVKILGVKK